MTEGAEIPAASGQASRRVVAGLIAAGLFLGYLLLWWDSYFAPNNGGEITVMNDFLKGRLPYRDYYSFQPPGAFFILFTIARAFGPRVLPGYVLGMVLRTAAVWSLYRLLSKSGRSPVVAAIASAGAAIAACTDHSETVSHYHHLSVAFLIFASHAAYPCVVPPVLERAPFLRRALLAGALAAVCFLLKQTTGVLGTGIMFLVIGVVMVRQRRASDAARFVVAALAGFLLVFGASAAWLSSNGLLGPYFHLVYGVAPAAKGGVLTSLLRPFTSVTSLDIIRVSLTLLGATVVAAGLALRGARAGVQMKSEIVVTAGIAAMIAFALYVGRFAAALRDPFYIACITMVYAGFVGSGAVMLVRARQLYRDALDVSATHGVFVGCLGFASAYSLAVSWPAFEPMIFPSLAVAVVEVDQLLDVHPSRASARTGGVVLLVLAMTVSSWRRHMLPYQWAYWSEPPISASEYRSKQPALWGITMSKNTATLIDGVTELIEENSDPGDKMIAFPHLWMFSGLADRELFGFAPVHWWDTCPDSVARADAEALLRDPPAIILLMDISPNQMGEQELFFRNGAPSGQRDLVAAMHTVIQRDGYRQLAAMRPPGSAPIFLFARPRPGAPPPPPPPHD